MADNKHNKKTGVGASETVSNVLEGRAERLLTRFMKHFADWPSVQRLIHGLSPTTVAALNELPELVGYLVGKIPDEAFVIPAVAPLCRSLMIEAAKNVGDIIETQRQGGGEANEPAAIKEGAAKAEQLQLALALGCVHMPDCVQLGALKPYQMQKVGLSSAIEQGLKASPCCFERIDLMLKKPAAPPPAPKKLRPGASVFDIIGRMPPEKQKAFVSMLTNLTPEQRQRLIAAIQKSLDSEEEFVGLTSDAISNDLRFELLPLLENRGILQEITAAIKRLGIDYEKFDAGLAQEVKKQQERYDQPRRRDPEPRGFLRSLLEMFLPF